MKVSVSIKLILGFSLYKYNERHSKKRFADSLNNLQNVFLIIPVSIMIIIFLHMIGVSIFQLLFPPVSAAYSHYS